MSCNVNGSGDDLPATEIVAEPNGLAIVSSRESGDQQSRLEMYPNSPNFITVDSMKVPTYRTRMSLSRNGTSDQITYTWTNLNVKTGYDEGEEPRFKLPFRKRGNGKGVKHILNNVSGILRPGELVALLGSSGAGKSTLMDVLTFRNSHKLKVSGIRAINGIPVESNTITSTSAYVQQMDLFMGVLTVREHLVFQARVRMHQHIPHSDRLEIVDEIIQEFGLTKCAQTQIGTRWFKGISGGEMKRLSIATEVLTDPMFMCADEPTSGLDSSSAQNVISILKKLANKGKTIVCTIHQPSSQLFTLFDRVILMAEGRVAFLGPSSEAVKFFGNHGYTCPPMFNPSDFLIDTLAIKAGQEAECKEAVSKICDAFFLQSQMNGNFDLVTNTGFVSVGKPPKQSPYKSSVYEQFSAVLKRSWICFARDPMVFKLRFIQTVFLGLLIGTIFYQTNLRDSYGVQNLTGSMFMILSALTYQHLLGALDNFCSELPVFFREHFNGMYRTDVYFISKLIVEFPFYVILPLVFAAIAYYMIGFEPSAMSFLKTWLVMFLITTICASLGCFLSCLATDIALALILTPAIIFPFFLFGGFLLRPGTGPWFLVWLEDVSWYYYGYEALAIVQLEQIKHIDCPFPLVFCPDTGLKVLKTLNFKETNFWVDITALTVLAVACQLLAYFSLLARTFRK